ncbi:hypothetical protein ACFSTH_11805 [Paenibacillus yanchengensis]|uniref:Uncharacterized protein n=1 Tax=Paenibacillus yanchengensis TaxID=2035833 RepID=A0ABW4YQX6_9BACL
MSKVNNNKKNGRVGRPRLVSEDEILDWKNEHGERFDDPRAIKFVQNLLQKNIINNHEIVAAHLLYDSSVSRINACKYKKGVYADVRCDWDNPELMTLDIITKKTDMWANWITQTFYYERTDEYGDRPSVDRVGENTGYTLENLQMLSISENVFKAMAKPHYIFNVTNYVMQIPSQTPSMVIRFETKQEAVESIGLKFKGDTGRFYLNGDQAYLIQSEAVTKGEIELEEYEDEDEATWYKGSFLAESVTDQHGKRYSVTRSFIFPQVVIVLKPKDIDAENTDSFDSSYV